MAWRMTSRFDPARWAAYDGDEWTADDETAGEIRTALHERFDIGLTPLGPWHTPTGPNDEVAVYLFARRALTPADEEGTPPPGATPPPLPDGAIS